MMNKCMLVKQQTILRISAKRRVGKYETVNGYNDEQFKEHKKE